MDNKEFLNYCKGISKDIASYLRYGNFVDAYVLLEDRVYKNMKIWEEVKDNPSKNHMLKEELAKAFSSCIYSKDAKQVVKELRKNDDNIFDEKVKDYLEKELEKFIQKDVLNRSRISKKKLKVRILREGVYYNYTNVVTEKQKANAPRITLQQGLDAINRNISYSRMRARNAQRLALNLPLIDINKYQNLQETSFIKEYKKFHSNDAELENRITQLADSSRKIEKYVKPKEKFFPKLVELNRIKRVPMYILEKAGILDAIRIKKVEMKAKRDGASKEEIRNLKEKAIKEFKLKMDKENEKEPVVKDNQRTVRINEENNKVLYFNKDDKVENLKKVPSVTKDRNDNGPSMGM